MVKDRANPGRRRQRRMKSVKLRSKYPKKGVRKKMKKISRMQVSLKL